MIKKVIHLLHLWISLPLGIIFSVICLTGAILVFENETLQLLNPQADVSSMGKHAPERRELVGYDFFRQTLRIHRWLLDAPAKKGTDGGQGSRWVCHAWHEHRPPERPRPLVAPQ